MCPHCITSHLHWLYHHPRCWLYATISYPSISHAHSPWTNLRSKMLVSSWRASVIIHMGFWTQPTSEIQYHCTPIETPNPINGASSGRRGTLRWSLRWAPWAWTPESNLSRPAWTSRTIFSEIVAELPWSFDEGFLNDFHPFWPRVLLFLNLNHQLKGFLQMFLSVLKMWNVRGLEKKFYALLQKDLKAANSLLVAEVFAGQYTFISQTLHVWNIYLHLPHKSPKCR